MDSLPPHSQRLQTQVQIHRLRQLQLHEQTQRPLAVLVVFELQNHHPGSLCHPTCPSCNRRRRQSTKGRHPRMAFVRFGGHAIGHCGSDICPLCWSCPWSSCGSGVCPHRLLLSSSITSTAAASVHAVCSSVMLPVMPVASNLSVPVDGR